MAIINSQDKIIGIISAKGGVGKTTTAINLAAAAIEMKKNPLIIDTNLNTGNLGLSLGLSYHPVAFYKIIKNPVSILQHVHKHKSGLHVIPSSFFEEEKNIENKGLNKKLKALTTYDLVILDSSPGINKDVKFVMETSDILLLVVTADLPTIITARKTVELAKKLDVKIAGIILNKVKRKKYELNKSYIETTLGAKIIGVVPYDENVERAIAARMPVVKYKKRTPASISFIKLCAALLGKKTKASLISKLVGIFRK